ncbi:MAG: response regulator [Candidatus Omnitrophica bacterium]|nr:response regulator [Candidatus Omnitrophota bacterium]
MVNLNKKFFTTGDIARIFGVSRISAYKWVVSGKIKSFKIPGGRYKITKKDLVDFIKKSGLDARVTGAIQQEDIKILIVDDQKLIIQTVRDYMEKTHPSWHISSASDGFEAGRMVSRINPDIVILDLFLPGINGFNLCKNIKNDPHTKDIKIIVITGYPTDENIGKAKDSGADAVLPKPFEMEELEKLILKSLP